MYLFEKPLIRDRIKSSERIRFMAKIPFLEVFGVKPHVGFFVRSLNGEISNQKFHILFSFFSAIFFCFMVIKIFPCFDTIIGL